jgi:hypothetical protein
VLIDAVLVLYLFTVGFPIGEQSVRFHGENGVLCMIFPKSRHRLKKEFPVYFIGYGYVSWGIDLQFRYFPEGTLDISWIELHAVYYFMLGDSKPIKQNMEFKYICGILKGQYRRDGDVLMRGDFGKSPHDGIE